MGKNNRKRRNTVDSNTFFVEKILNKRVNADNEIEYFIKWKGFNDDWNTWEPAGNCNCKALIDAYDEEHSNVKFESLQEDNTVAAKKIKVESGLCNPSASVMIKVSPDETGIVTGAVFVPSSSSTSIDINESTNFGDNNAEHKQVFEASSTVKKCDVELSSSPCASLEATKNAVASEKALSTNADPLSRESNSVVVPLIPVTPFEDGAKQSTSTNERVDKTVKLAVIKQPILHDAQLPSTSFHSDNAEHKQVLEASSAVKKCDVELSSSPCVSLEVTNNSDVNALEKTLSHNADPLSRECNSIQHLLIHVTPIEDGAKQSTPTNERVDKTVKLAVIKQPMSRDAPSASFPSRSGNAETKQFDYAECEKKLKEATELILSANELLKVSKFVKISLKLAKQNLEKSASGLFQKWQSLKNCDDYATIDHYRSKIYDKVKEIREVVVNISNVFKKLNSDKIVSFSDTVTTVVVGYCRLDGTPKSKTPSFNNGNNPSSSS